MNLQEQKIMKKRKLKIKITEEQLKKIVKSYNEEQLNEGFLSFISEFLSEKIKKLIELFKNKVIDKKEFKSELESTASDEELEKIDTEYKKFKEDKKDKVKDIKNDTKTKAKDIKNDTKNIIIGDSITPHLAKVGGTRFSSGPKALNATDYSGVGLWYGGIGLGGLQKMADAYKTVHPKVKNVVITIGTNGYGGTGGVSTLATNLKRIFPNAKLFVCQGAYGPGWKNTEAPSLAKYTDKYISKFYSAFTDAGIIVVPYPIKDTVKNVHSPNVPVYKKWALFINNNAN